MTSHAADIGIDCRRLRPIGGRSGIGGRDDVRSNQGPRQIGFGTEETRVAALPIVNQQLGTRRKLPILLTSRQPAANESQIDLIGDLSIAQAIVERTLVDGGWGE